MKLTVYFLFLVGTLSFGQRSDFVDVDFKEADSIAKKYKGSSLRNLPVLVHNLTVDLPSEVEKFRSIYTWVSSNISNDYNAYLRTSKRRKKLKNNREAYLEWNQKFTPQVLKKLMEEKKTACTGYAYLIREMALLAGINCKIINGYGRTPTLILDNNSTANHSWNTVEIDGKWYLCDATWSAGKVFIEDDGPRFQQEYHDGYFLPEPALFVKNHYPLEINNTFLPEPPTFDEFIEGPVVYKDAFSENIVPIAPSKMFCETQKGHPISFALKTSLNFDVSKLSLVINNGGRDQIIQPQKTMEDNNLTLTHSFAKNGLYDVHVKSEDYLIASYVVKVKRK